MLDLGDAWVGQVLFTSDGSTAADPTTVTCTITLPDLVTTATATVTQLGTGSYQATYTPLVDGRFLVRWLGTGANFAAINDQFDVRTAASFTLLSLQDARDTLNYDDADIADDEEIRDYNDVTTRLIERHIGPVIPRTVTEDVIFSDASSWFVVRQPPLISLTSITPVLTNGVAYSVGDFHPVASGKVIRSDANWLVPGVYTVVYQAGVSGRVDPDVMQAARVLLQHLWATQRGTGSRPGQALDDSFGANYTMPNRVLELLQLNPARQIGIA